MKLLHLSARVPAELAGERLDLALSRLFDDRSRALLQRWIAAGAVQVDGAPARRPRDRVWGGEHIEIEARPPEPGRDEPEAIALQILFEDEHILVLDKPAGLVVHPGAGNPTGTLLNALLHHCPDSDTLPRAGLVHRIDRNTSGTLVVAKTATAQTALSRDIARHAVERCYLAVTHGHPPASGRIDAPIARHPRLRTRMAVRDSGRAAVTHFRLRARYRRHSLLSLKLETGRTHQIRVHMAHLGHPIVGDADYGGARRPPVDVDTDTAAALGGLTRQALHARRLTLTHPVSGDAMRFDAPLPRELAALVRHLARDSRRPA